MYVFCRDAWGRLAGFLFGWGQISMIRAASLGGIAITFAEYFFRVMGFDPLAPENVSRVHWTAAGAIALTGAFNYRRRALRGERQQLHRLAKYGGLLFIIVVAFAFGLPHNGAAHFTPAVPPGSFTRAGVRPRARLDALGVRRLGRSRVQRRRSARIPAAISRAR